MGSVVLSRVKPISSSELSFQLRSIRLGETAVPLRPEGAVGVVVVYVVGALITVVWPPGGMALVEVVDVVVVVGAVVVVFVVEVVAVVMGSYVTVDVVVESTAHPEGRA